MVAAGMTKGACHVPPLGPHPFWAYVRASLQPRITIFDCNLEGNIACYLCGRDYADPLSNLDYKVRRDKGGFSQAGLTPLEEDIEVNTESSSKVVIKFIRVPP